MSETEAYDHREQTYEHAVNRKSSDLSSGQPQNEALPSSYSKDETCYDLVTHPQHYVNQVQGIECWDVTKHFPFLRGNAIKYLWRAGDKDDIIQDLRKAITYINKEIEFIEQNRRNS